MLRHVSAPVPLRLQILTAVWSEGTYFYGLPQIDLLIVVKSAMVGFAY